MLNRSITDTHPKVKLDTSEKNEVHTPLRMVPEETFLKAQEELQRANKRIRELEQENQQLKAAKKQERALWKTQFKPAEKLLIQEIQRQMDNPTVKDEDGYSRICFETAAINIGMSSSTPKRKIEAILEQAPNFPLEMKIHEEYTEDGKKIPRFYAKAKENIIQAAITAELENIRKQGGNKYLCQKCGSSDVKIKRRLHCNCCGHETDLEDSYPNGKLKNNTGRSNLLSEDDTIDDSPNKSNTGETGKSNLLLENTIPPAEVFDESVQLDDVKKPDTPPIAEQADSLLLETEAAQLLQNIAGTYPIHIGMNRRGESKYRTIKGKLTLEEALEHLRGIETYGALCSRSDGRTRALCWDTDSTEEWELFKEYARTLVTAGYLVILEESPAGRGGHLWIIFDGLVDASAARSAVCVITPELVEVKEYWPAPEYGKGNRVRLPGGKYLRPEIEEWCMLVSVADGEISMNGTGAARLLLTHQTLASILPFPDPGQGDQQPAQVELDPVLPIVRTESCNSDQVKASQVEQEPIGVANVDARWEQQYGSTSEGRRLWFAWTDEYLIARYNARTSPQDLVDINREGKALATWRGERTASVAIRGEQWTDFGASARRSDGSPDSGDAFELCIRLSGKSKSQVLGELGKALVREARQLLESAARSGESLPEWLEEIITPAGRAHYNLLRYGSQSEPNLSPADENFPDDMANRLCVAADPLKAEDEESTEGGVSGFQSVSAPIPMSNTGYFPGEPCLQCACELYRLMAGEPACIRCYPKNGSKEFADRLYPKKQSHITFGLISTKKT